MGSQIREYFAGKTVFLTGATGFLGKLVMEKLLRACFQAKKICLLVRHKRGIRPEDRLTELFNEPVFGPLKTQSPNFLDRVSLFIGDCELPNLGLNAEDLAVLRNDVNVIIHCAATVNFDEKLRKATHINVRALLDLLKIAEEMANLSSFVYVSTAFSNCIADDIDEEFYKPPLAGQSLVHLVNLLEEDVLNAITTTITGKWPNTYVVTKAVAEDVVKTHGRNLPVSIVRPSLITACAVEPLPGWADNSFGITRVLVQTYLGLVRTFRNDPAKIADLVPADYVANSIIATAWETAEKGITDEAPLIYNYVSGCQNPITWADYEKLSSKYAYKFASNLSRWHFIFLQIRHEFLYLLAEFLFHTVPAYAADLFLWCSGRKPMYVTLYRKVAKFCERTSYFSLRSWNHTNQNTQNLWNRMNETDKRLFEFDIRLINWDEYFSAYLKGIRIYCLKDPLDTIPRGQKKAFRFKIAHYTIVSLVFCLILSLLYKIATVVCV